jgi:hypothetical protein
MHCVQLSSAHIMVFDVTVAVPAIESAAAMQLERLQSPTQQHSPPPLPHTHCVNHCVNPHKQQHPPVHDAPVMQVAECSHNLCSVQPRNILIKHTLQQHSTAHSTVSTQGSQ